TAAGSEDAAEQSAGGTAAQTPQADRNPAEAGAPVPEADAAVLQQDSSSVAVAARVEPISAERDGGGPKRRGPKTLKGKARASFNALKHGISAKIAIIPGVERAEDWRTFRDEIRRDLAAEGFLETALAERVASCAWRLRRVVAFETASISAEQAEAGSGLR